MTCPDGVPRGAGPSTTTCSQNLPSRWIRSAVRIVCPMDFWAKAGTWNASRWRPCVVDRTVIGSAHLTVSVW